MTLSFVIPCYNVERYVAQCLDSVFAVETIKHGFIVDTDYDYEVICVNDCSTDATALILRHYAMQHANLRVVDLPQNVGWGGVRNIALTYAKGDYIWYVDSDDTIVSEKAESLVNEAVVHNLDVLGFNFNNLDECGNLIRPYYTFRDTEVLSGSDYIKKYLCHNFSANIGFVWRFLYKASFLKDNKISFPEGRCWEDTLFMPQTVLMSRRMKSVSYVAYSYWRHYSSAVMTFSKLKPGKMIYQFCINAGLDILHLYKQETDPTIKDMLYSVAVDGYFNQAALLLCQTNAKERSNFYQIAKQTEHKSEVNEVRPHLKKMSRIMLSSALRRPAAELVAFAYNIKHIKRFNMKNNKCFNLAEPQYVSDNLKNSIPIPDNVDLAIIVPVYNSEKYLEECLQSIANQTYKNYICVLVNDGSTDGSQTVIDAFCSRDKRFVSLVKHNEKSADMARKYAIERVATTWLMHVDADDVIVPDFVERMVKRQQQTDADLVCGRLVGCQNGIDGVDYTVPVPQFDMSQCLQGPTAFLQNIGGWAFSANAGVLYRRSLTEGITYKGYVNSDEYSQRLLVYNADKVAFEDVKYLYRTNEGISEHFSARIFSRTLTDQDLMDFVDYHYPYNSGKRQVIRKQYFFNLVYLIDDFYSHKQLLTKAEQFEIKSILKYSHTMFRTKINANAVNTPPLQLFARLPYCLFKWFALLFVTLRRKKGRKYYYK